MTIASLSGFFAAHAAWSVSDGGVLVPIYAYEGAGGERQMVRLAHDQLEMAVAAGRERLSANPDEAQRAVLIFDGYVPVAGTRTDALILEARDYAAGNQLAMAIPYVPNAKGSIFKVYAPIILRIPESEDPQEFTESFWQGVESHEKGADLWISRTEQLRPQAQSVARAPHSSALRARTASRQLVDQLPLTEAAGVDSLIRVEETLVQAFAQNEYAVVDGHDMAENKFNIYILPKGAWGPVVDRVIAFLKLRGVLGSAVIAKRLKRNGPYKIIWPVKSGGTFQL
jgi:hypothetical protein